MHPHEELLKKLQVDIDPELLELALTHSSYAFENNTGDYERLEFLGDSVLGLAISSQLYLDVPDGDENDLSRRHHAVVSTIALAEVARGLGLGEHIRLGKGMTADGGADQDGILADVLEALFGAAYLSAGPEAAQAFVLRTVGPLLAEAERYGAAIDPKTALRVAAASAGLSEPETSVVASGEAHAPQFTATVSVGEISVTADGRSKKAAELAASLAAWQQLTGSDA